MKGWKFYSCRIFFLFHQGFVSVDVSSSSDSVLLFFCIIVQIYNIFMCIWAVCVYEVSVVQEPCK